MLIDTHAHLYLNNFNEDIDEVIKKSIANGVSKIILPNIDENSKSDLIELYEKYPQNLFPAIGLHPTSVRKNFEEQIDLIFRDFSDKYIAVGEIGIDLYWDKSLEKEQVEAFRMQLDIAIEKQLPVIIHSRNSMNKILDVIDDYDNRLKGVFHCFSGNYDQAIQVIKKGFYIGVGGIITYKNSDLKSLVEKIPLEKIILETDSPFLPPVPFRGKRNEPGHLKYIAIKLAEIKKVSLEIIENITKSNSEACFKI